MSIPLAKIHQLQEPDPRVSSLGDAIAETFTDSNPPVAPTLLSCLPTTNAPALFSPNLNREPLTHAALHSFVASFQLPYSPLVGRLGPNDRVVLALPTGPENALALLSIAAYHTAAPVNAACTAAELREDAERLRAKAVFTMRESEERLELRELRAELGIEVYYLDARVGAVCGLFDVSTINMSDDMSIMTATDVPHPGGQLHGLYDQSLVLHTSGTSGKKKVVPYSLRSLIVGTLAVAKSWALKPSDVNMNMMPLFHVGGIVRNLLAPMMSGGSAIMCAGFDADAFWTLAVDLQATWYYAAPTIHHAILASRPSHIIPTRDTALRMICNAAGGLLPSLAVEVRDTFGGAIVLPSYGMTECMPISTPLQNYALDRPGCSGLACGPYLSIRNAGSIERELRTGETGAVCVRGLPTFEGYEVWDEATGQPRLDTSCFTSEGWFDSGDCGYMDEDGYLYITGRSKEIINKGGEVISPFEVEEAIMLVAKERVKTVLAFAIEHDVLQETIGIAVVCQSDQPRIGLSELCDMLRDSLHPSKWPFAIVYMEDLPKNNAGKPLRIKLAQRLGITTLSDSVPSILRHFQADIDPKRHGNLAEPIPCSAVTVDLQAIENSLAGIIGVHDVAVRESTSGGAGAVEAFIYMDEHESGAADAAAIRSQIMRTLPGYAIPDPLHIFAKPLMRAKSGIVDFEAMRQFVSRQNAARMSSAALTIRSIIADLLDIEVALVSGDSDFFLLGGNSLLLGRLAYFIKKQTGVAIAVPDLFTNSTVNGMAKLVEKEEALGSNSTLSANEEVNEKTAAAAAVGMTSDNSSEDTLGYGWDMDDYEIGRGQTHPVSLITQAIPFLFFYPLKAAWTWAILLFVLSNMPHFFNNSYWVRMAALLIGILAARITSRIVCPIAALLFKWLVIGKYKPGVYKMWSTYYLRWWIVNQSLRAAGRGVFGIHPTLERMYLRMLGAKIGSNVQIAKHARLTELDLLTIEDGVRIDSGSSVRGFCVERDGYFRLERVHIGRKAVINTYTQVCPGAVIEAGAVYGPHSSSNEDPSPRSFVAYNRNLLPQPNFFLKYFVGAPIILLVTFVSYLPWFAAIWMMINYTNIDRELTEDKLNSMEGVVYWFSTPERVAWHTLSRVVRAILTPLIRVFLGIIVKRILGKNKEGPMSEKGQLTKLRWFVNGTILSQHSLKRAFDILGTHYQMTSVVWRMMGANIGKRVYWPGSGVYCLDPELVTVGDDVVFGSRSEFFTTDRLGSGRITVDAGAMIADRVVLLPGTHVGRRAVMGSGALGKRDAHYDAGSTWMGSLNGEAMCFSKGTAEALDTNVETITPFGRAFYRREATFFVFPYIMLVIINTFVAATSAAYWSLSAVTAAQILRQVHLRLPGSHIYNPTWYRFGALYGIIAVCFIVVLNAQAVLALLWVVVTKWLVIGRRKQGKYEWDQSSYCQRWQLHLTLSRIMHRGFGNGGVLAPITGSAYIVWFFRAQGAKIGKNVSVFAGGKLGLMTEPDLVELGDNVNLDDCSVVGHINSRGKFALNNLKIGPGCALRSGSRLLSGACMEDSSMLCEHTLLTSGEIAESGQVYVGWPARLVPVDDYEMNRKTLGEFALDSPPPTPGSATFICPICHNFPKGTSVTLCGHIFCDSCITRSLDQSDKCPVCAEPASMKQVMKIYPSFVLPA